QANMDPNHRDRIAFIRVVSGKFERDMNVVNARSGKRVRLSNASKLFGNERETIEEAYPGDVLGVVGNALFNIGDTLTDDPGIVYDEIPHFAPECFSFIDNPSPAAYKRFRSGLSQLLEEGVAQMYDLPDAVRKVPLLGAAGPLQFEIVQYRLESEYGSPSKLEAAPWTMARWLDPEANEADLQLPSGVRIALDSRGRKVLLITNEWTLRYFQDKHPDVKLSDIPFDHAMSRR
ncbi:MAG: peptide chain release factor 3, partial [Candidatus Hydrogenedentes bacterium]|nr:peptide chain release factor 3 [Candidatus Hydrogenedentota bacterium]